jgi:hypothetical protein
MSFASGDSRSEGK